MTSPQPRNPLIFVYLLLSALALLFLAPIVMMPAGSLNARVLLEVRRMCRR